MIQKQIYDMFPKTNFGSPSPMVAQYFFNNNFTCFPEHAHEKILELVYFW